MSASSQPRLSIAIDYSPSPAGRTAQDGPFNGARFRDRLLAPRLRQAISDGRSLTVDFDEADSYSSSFLEEAFGGLVRLKVFSRQEIEKYLNLEARDPVFSPYKLDAQQYIIDELRKEK